MVNLVDIDSKVFTLKDFLEIQFNTLKGVLINSILKKSKLFIYQYF